MLVTPEALDALDCLLWLSSGYRAAQLCGCNQSSISRRAQEAARVFGLTLVRDRADWQLSGSTLLLDLEREVHQLHRLLRCSGLRLDVATEMALLVPRLESKAWIPACVETATPERSLDLLERRVTDGWLTPASGALLDGQGAVVPIRLAGGVADGALLVVRPELADHPACHQLLELLGPRVCSKPAQVAPQAGRRGSIGSSLEKKRRMGRG